MVLTHMCREMSIGHEDPQLVFGVIDLLSLIFDPSAGAEWGGNGNRLRGERKRREIREREQYPACIRQPAEEYESV